jgi:Transposase IS66 family
MRASASSAPRGQGAYPNLGLQRIGYLFANKHVESNSGLGDTLRYLLSEMREPLTLFLRAVDAPIDNNISERSLKQAIRQRRDALFYRSRKRRSRRRARARASAQITVRSGMPDHGDRIGRSYRNRSPLRHRHRSPAVD